MNLLTPDEVAAILKIPPLQFRQRVQFRPGFPKPIVLSQKVKRWREDDIQSWILAPK